MIKVVMMMAVTLDGKIAKNSGHFSDWTSREDKQLFVRTSREIGVVMMGERTFETFPAPLKERLNVVFTEKKDNPEIPGVKWVSGDPKKVLEELESMGYVSAMLGGGSFLNSLFLKDKLIDEIIVTVEPKIFGLGLSLFDCEIDADLELLETGKLNENSVMLKYKVVYKN